jgi:hypothetical protein
MKVIKSFASDPKQATLLRELWQTYGYGRFLSGWRAYVRAHLKR